MLGFALVHAHFGRRSTSEILSAFCVTASAFISLLVWTANPVKLVWTKRVAASELMISTSPSGGQSGGGVHPCPIAPNCSIKKETTLIVPCGFREELRDPRRAPKQDFSGTMQSICRPVVGLVCVWGGEELCTSTTENMLMLMLCASHAGKLARQPSQVRMRAEGVNPSYSTLLRCNCSSI